jgi:beta-N-acetylhexosaminidase
MNIDKTQIIILIIIFIILISLIIYLNYHNTIKKIKQSNTNNIKIENSTIDFSSLTLQQKIAQMIIVRADNEDYKYTNLNIGGIFLDKQNSVEQYKKIIENYQQKSKINLFVSTDLEGAWTPFHNPTPKQKFPKFDEIKTSKQAYDIGIKHGELLKNIGFNLNFAPVAELEDNVYGGRAFKGTNQEIQDKIASYIQGLQKYVLGTCKHYPGKAMKKNLHYVSDKQNITKDDLSLFETCVKNNISAIMVSHQKVTGELNSQNKPSTVSKPVISSINNSTLVIADEINMLGLRRLYPRKITLYKELINSGENLILDFQLSPESLYKLIENIEQQVEKGDINKENIDKSVKKILKTKGYKIK